MAEHPVAIFCERGNESFDMKSVCVLIHLSGYWGFMDDFVVQNERPRLKWEDNIKVDVKGLGCEREFWTELAQVTVKWQGP
jgi:hypothetical protein